MSISRRLAVLVIAGGTITAGLVSGATVEAANAGSEGGSQSVEVVIKSDHTFVMASSIKPGVTTFKVTSRRSAQFQLIRPHKGYTRREFARDNTGLSKNNLRALRRFEANTTLYGGFPVTPARPGVMSVDLPRGAYWAVDVGPRSIRPANIKRFSVSGHSVGGTLSGTVIAAVGEHAWAKRPRSIPAHGQILFENKSTENHFLDMARLLKGKTVKDFGAWLKQQGMSAPPVDDKTALDTGVISPGVSMSLPYRLTPGRYVMSCFWADAEEGGKPHAALGMYRGIKVG